MVKKPKLRKNWIVLVGVAAAIETVVALVTLRQFDIVLAVALWVVAINLWIQAKKTDQ